MTAWLQQGGFLLLALGPRASQLPLGSSLEPIFMHPVRWNTSAALMSLSIDSLNAQSTNSEKLSAKGRSILDPTDLSLFETKMFWSDKLPFLLHRSIGRGAVWLVTLPFALELSDFPLRPMFLHLLDQFTMRARDQAEGLRTEPGSRVTATLSESLQVNEFGVQPNVPLTLERASSGQFVTLSKIGAYSISRTNSSGHTQSYVQAIAPAVREIDLRARELKPQDSAQTVRSLQRSTIEVTSYLLVFLWIVIASEVIVRAVRLIRARANVVSESS